MKNDVDTLACQRVGDGLHAGAAHADTRAHGIDARIVALHGDLRAQTRVARRAEYLDKSLADLRNLDLKQVDQKLR